VTSETFTAESLVADLACQGVQMLHLGPRRIRAVTHYGITGDDIDRALSVMSDVTRG